MTTVTPDAPADVRELHAKLGRHARMELLGLLVDDLSDSPEPPGVQRTPGVCGGAACIRRTRIPVWLLEEGRRAGISESDLLLDHPGLTAADLVRAWAYVAANPQEIEDELRRQEEA